MQNQLHRVAALVLIVGAMGGRFSAHASPPAVHQESGSAWNETSKLLPSDGAASHQFGFDVVLEDDTLIVGAPNANGVSVKTGAAYVFKRVGNVWVEDQKLFAGVGEFNDVFGVAVALDGDTLVVGARNRGRSGSAFVFERGPSGWVETAELVPSMLEYVSYFGEAVAVSGDTVLVGAGLSRHLQPANPFCFSGSAHVFRKVEGAWRETATLLPSACGEQLGRSVAIDGSTAMVGALFGGNGIASGSVYVYTRDATGWTMSQELVPSDPTSSAHFGDGIALSGDVASIGAEWDDAACPSDPNCNSGAAYVFRHAGSTWSEEAKLTASDAAAGDWFGSSVSMSGERIAIGAFLGDGLVPDSGAAYVFRHDTAGWSEEAVLTASDGAHLDYFGVVSLDGDTVAVGAIEDDDNGSSSGSAYVFERLLASSAFRNAGTNPASYMASAPVLGSNWNASVDLSTTGHSHAQVIGHVASASLALPGGQVLLVGGPQAFQLPLQPGPTASWSVPIPNDSSLAGITIYTQAAHLFGVAPFALSNAQDLFVGY